MEKYEIMDVIDEGAYGIVWKAINKQSNVLGTSPPNESPSNNSKKVTKINFHVRPSNAKSKCLKCLKGDYVVNIKQAFKKKGKVYLIFEHFQHNLLNLIQKFQHGLQPPLINILIYKIIKCLQYLHSKNIIHRDVKPENLLLNSDYSLLKICDFGFARFLPQKQYDLTEYVATRWYRSPELLVGQPYGKPSDLWAVGCMIGQLVDGQPMFPGDDQIDQIHLINKLVGSLTPNQKDYFRVNPKFENIQLPSTRREQTIDTKYLGVIEKNALSFMKACLKMNPAERITVEQALKHPFLLSFSLQDNQFANDEQNLLEVPRKNPIKNDSKVSLANNDEEQRGKAKIMNNSIIVKKSLKLESGSVNERQLHMPTINNDAEVSSFHKKKSHTNLQTLKLDDHLEKSKSKKLNKMMSEQKNLKLNFDVNLKINLKINQKNVDRRDIKDQLETKLDNKLNLNGSSKTKLPQIKNNSKGMRYHLNIRHQKANPLISVIGQTKELIRGSKPNLHT